jgi:hypothetical protein
VSFTSLKARKRLVEDDDPARAIAWALVCAAECLETVRDEISALSNDIHMIRIMMEKEEER